MPTVRPAPSFIKALAKLTRDRTQAARIRQAIERFAADIHHPGLNFEKVTGTRYCTIRVSVHLRILMIQSAPDSFDLVDIGDHDHIYRRR